MFLGEIRPGIQFIKEADMYSGRSEKVMTAFVLAKEIHINDTRKTTGEPYINHCVAVASILESWGADEDEVVAGLLHDTIEDHPGEISLEDISGIFGERVAQLVNGVTKLGSDFETLRKITSESLIEPGVAFIKLADRLHNMLTMKGMSEASQRKNAQETLDVYAPLAESFGMWQIKNQLADLAFAYTDPKRHSEVKRIIDNDPRLRLEFIKNTKANLEEIFLRAGLRAVVEHQVGGYYELSEKQRKSVMKDLGRPKSFEQITDVVSFRILVENAYDLDKCYLAMGLVRLEYGDMLEKGRHDDFLVEKVMNGYSAIHDTYKFPEGCVEMAFTSRDREAFNNWGLLCLPRRVLIENPERFNRKVVFTPKRELVFLEPPARGIDLAYKINPLLGLRAVALRVNGKIKDLSEVVENAGVVEVITDIHQNIPRAEWMEYCNQETRKQIEAQRSNSEREEVNNRGREMLAELVLRERGVLNIEDLPDDILGRVLMDLGCWNGVENLYYKVTFGLDIDLIKKKLIEVGVVGGRYSTVRVRGKNRIGVSELLARIIAKSGGDVRRRMEVVEENERYEMRVLMEVSYEGKKKIEQEVADNFDEWEMV